MCQIRAPIVPLEDWHHLECTKEKVIAEWESGSRSNHQSNVFCQDNAIVYHLVCIAFADFPGEVHCILRKGKVQQGGKSPWVLTLPVLSAILGKM